MRSRITKFAAAAVLALTVLLLARHLAGRDTTIEPQDTDRFVAHVSDSADDLTTETFDDQEQQLHLAQELFAQADVESLALLLDTGQDQTKIAVAGYLAALGDKSALPALQRLADQWQGAADDNPFLSSIERIREAAAPQEQAEAESVTQAPPSESVPVAEDGRIRIAVEVCEKATGEPVPHAGIRTAIGAERQTHTADEQGRFVFDLGESMPSYASISVRPEGYVWQSLSLQGRNRQSLPRTVRFSLERATVIGGIVQDSEGRPVEGASVEGRLRGRQPQQFDQPQVSVSIEQSTDAQGRWRSGNVPADVGELWFNVYHPDFAAGGFEMPTDLKLEDLRAERAVMVLKAGMTVTGSVTDGAGNPIAGADLLAGEDYFARDWAKTDAAGRFEFRNLSPINQSFLLTVQAPGFAPQRRELPSEKGLAPVDFVLEPARLLIGRVVDAAGKPVEGASLITEDWNGHRTVKWQGKTDEKGMFVWDYPPADAIQIRISKSGYREFLRDVVADDRQQTFVLVSPTVIKGSVTDSETGEAVKLFKVTPGIRWSVDSSRATWQTTDSWVRWFTDGHYSYGFSYDGSAYAVRIEAEGYVPVESRFVDAGEQEVTIDIALTKGQGPSGFVFDVNAAPVEGAQVFWEKTLWLENGRAETRNRTYTETDREGRFAFKADNRSDWLVAVCDRGIGIVSHEEFSQSGIITLTPWARVEGRLWAGNQPVVGQTLQLMPEQDRSLRGISLDYNHALTDENGRFLFDRVYPGQFTLYNQTYEVAPGQTLELYLGGTGRTVKGQLALPGPSDIPIWVDMQLVSIDPRTGETRRVQMDDRTTFHVDNVPPGLYALKGAVRHQPAYERTATSGSMGSGLTRVVQIIGRFWHDFEVPLLTDESELDIPLDLGVLAVLPGELKPGDPAPDFDVPTFGSDHVRLADHRGSVLLLTFFSWDYVERNAAILQDLRDLHQRFGADPRYAQVSLLLSDDPVLDRRAVDEAKLDWPIGLVQGRDSKEAVEYSLARIPWNVLIDPAGNVLAVGLSGEDLQQAIEAALTSSP